MNKHPGLDCILLVDDDPSMNFINRKIIQTSEVDVHIYACESGKSALDYLEGHEPFHNNGQHPPPNIIFLDINMPGMNGWEFLEEYDRLPSEKKEKTVVVILTTSINPDDMEMAEKNDNVYSFVSKPLKADYINQLVSEKFS